MTSCCLNLIILDIQHDITNSFQSLIQTFSKIKLIPTYINIYIPADNSSSEIEETLGKASTNLKIEYTIIQKPFINFKSIYSLLYSKSNKYGQVSVFIDLAYNTEVIAPYIYDETNKYSYVEQYDGEYSYSVLFSIKNSSEYTELPDDVKIREYGKLDTNNHNIISSIIFHNSGTSIKNNYIFLFNHIKGLELIDRIYCNLVNNKYSNIIEIYSKYQTVIYNELDKYNRWAILYIVSVSYYRIDNFKKAKHISNLCLQLLSSKLEPLYILSIIEISNGNYIKSYKLLKKFNSEDLKSHLVMFKNSDIYKYLIHYNLFNTYKGLNNTLQGIALSDCLLCRSMPTGIQKELYQYIDDTKNLEEYSSYDSCYSFMDSQLEYEHESQYYLNLNNVLTTLIIKEGELHLNNKFNSTIIKIENKPNNFSCINHNDEYISIFLFEYDKMVMYRLSIEDYILTQISEFCSPISIIHIRWVTKLVYYKNIYIGVVRSTLCSNNLYRLCYLKNNNYSIIGFSNIFKLDVPIKDMFLEDDQFVFVCKTSYIRIPISYMYINYNIPIDYPSNIEHVLEDQFNINLSIGKYSLSNLKYKNYKICKDNPIANIHIDLESMIISNINTSQCSLIKEFIYLPQDSHHIVNISKEYDVVFYNNKTDIDLFNVLQRKKVVIGSEYIKSKYLIIGMNELKDMNMTELSNIIFYNCLIIVLINQDDLENNVSNIYCENTYLNKLYLFNIVKNKDYKDFIYERIIEQDQYTARSEYFEIDKKNILNKTHPIKYALNYIEKIDKNDKLYEEYFTKYSYKLDLITALYSKTENINIIEILKLILYNDQNITVLYQSTVDPLIVKLNIIGNVLCIKNINLTEITNITCVIILDNKTLLSSLDNVYDDNSLIYIIDEDKLIYTI